MMAMMERLGEAFLRLTTLVKTLVPKFSPNIVGGKDKPGVPYRFDGRALFPLILISFRSAAKIRNCLTATTAWFTRRDRIGGPYRGRFRNVKDHNIVTGGSRAWPPMNMVPGAI